MSADPHGRGYARQRSAGIERELIAMKNRGIENGGFSKQEKDAGYGYRGEILRVTRIRALPVVQERAVCLPTYPRITRGGQDHAKNASSDAEHLKPCSNP